MNNSPKQLKPDLWVFPIQKSVKGSNSWWLGCKPEPILVDCPLFNNENIELLKKLSLNQSPRIILTSRESHDSLRAIHKVFGWPVLVQEQEEYLLPGFTPLETFCDEHETISGIKVLWTPGPTPGTCVIHAQKPWNVLFCGPLIIPKAFNLMGASRNRKTFHWSLQQKSLEKLRKWIPANSSPELASGGYLGPLGEERLLPWEAWGFQGESLDT